MAAACAPDAVLLATSKGYLLRYHWDDHGNEKGGSSRGEGRGWWTQRGPWRGAAARLNAERGECGSS